jgi:hypothetical protein
MLILKVPLEHVKQIKYHKGETKINTTQWGKIKNQISNKITCTPFTCICWISSVNTPEKKIKKRIKIKINKALNPRHKINQNFN